MARRGERGGQHVFVELRVGARARNGPHVDQHAYLRGGQEIGELYDLSRGMADGEERKRAIMGRILGAHVPSMHCDDSSAHVYLDSGGLHA